MHRSIMTGLTVACLLTGEAAAQYPYYRGGYAGAGLLGGIVGGILQSMPAPSQQPALAQQPPPPGQVTQPTATPDTRIQQQTATEHQRPAAEASAKAGQRQRAATDAKTRQHQAEVKAQADAKASTDAADRKNREIANKLRADPSLVSALGPDQHDISALIAAKDTQNVVRNLRGDPLFVAAPTACLPFGGLATQSDSPDMRFFTSVTAAIEQQGGLGTHGTSLMVTACDPSELGHYDLLIFSAAQVANGPAEILSPLVAVLSSRQFVHFGTFTATDFAASEQARLTANRAEEARKHAEREADRVSFKLRDPATIAAIYTDVPATVVCVMTADVAGVRDLLKRGDSPLAGLVTEASVIREVPSADAIFIAMKRHDCAAAIASAGMLQDVVAALVRDGVDVDIHNATINRDQLVQTTPLSRQATK